MPRRALVLAALAPAALGVHHFKELNNLDDLNLLGFASNGVAVKHSLIGFAREECEQNVRRNGFPREFSTLGEEFETGEVYMDKHSEIAQVFNVSDCNTYLYFPKGANVTSEFDRIDNVGDQLQLTNWFYEHIRHSLEVNNDLPFDVEVRWEDNAGTERTLIEIPSRKAATLNTFLSHHMTFYKKELGKAVPVLRLRVDDSPSVALSELVNKAFLEQCQNPDDCAAEPLADDRVQISPEDIKVWQERDRANRDRVVRNEEQPKMKPKFTEFGYKKMRIPDDVYQLILNRYNAGKHEPQTEPWTPGDCHTNFFEAPSKMIYLTDDEKTKIFAGLQPILEEWAGGIKLEPTSCYGIRVYYNNSWLREHVDTGATHIISGIMQIDQDVDEDWHLTFVDNKGDRHYITMQPGDLTLYESSTCLHGRPVPFRGRYFANVFVHFKDV